MKKQGDDRGNVGPGHGHSTGATRTMPLSGSGGGMGTNTMRGGPSTMPRSQGKPPGNSGVTKPVKAHEAKPLKTHATITKSPTQTQKL